MHTTTNTQPRSAQPVNGIETEISVTEFKMSPVQRYQSANVHNVSSSHLLSQSPRANIDRQASSPLSYPSPRIPHHEYKSPQLTKMPSASSVISSSTRDQASPRSSTQDPSSPRSISSNLTHSPRSQLQKSAQTPRNQAQLSPRNMISETKQQQQQQQNLLSKPHPVAHRRAKTAMYLDVETIPAPRPPSESKDDNFLDDSVEEPPEHYMFLFMSKADGRGFSCRVFDEVAQGQKEANEDILTYQKKLIKGPLFSSHTILKEDCCQTFKNVMSYMRDRRSSKEPPAHAQKILKMCLNSGIELRDEVILQICKQVTRHTDSAHSLLGWELLLVVLAAIAPSKHMARYLRAFLLHKKAQGKPTIQPYITAAMLSMEKIVLLGSRKTLMNSEELQAITKMHKMMLQVFFVDGTSTQVQYDSFTTIKDVTEEMKVKLNAPNVNMFTIYSDGGLNRQLKPDERIVDVKGAWAELEKSNNKSKLPTTPSRFLLKVRLFVAPTSVHVCENESLLRLFFWQSSIEVAKGHYDLEDHDIQALAALKLYSYHGSYQKELHDANWIKERISRLLPEGMCKKEDAVKNLILCYSIIDRLSSIDAIMQYLQALHDAYLYGATFYEVQQLQFVTLPSTILIAITCHGVTLCDQSYRVLEHYVYEEVSNWGSSDAKFFLIIGPSHSQKKFAFVTAQGQEMTRLIRDYLAWKIEETKSTQSQ